MDKILHLTNTLIIIRNAAQLFQRNKTLNIILLLETLPNFSKEIKLWTLF